MPPTTLEITIQRRAGAEAAALATAFYTHLRAHGEVHRALAEACAGLAERGDITVPALYSRLGGLPLFSDSLDRDLTPNEVSNGLEQLRALPPNLSLVSMALPVDPMTNAALTRGCYVDPHHGVISGS